MAIIKAMGQLKIEFKDSSCYETSKKFFSIVNGATEVDITPDLAVIMKRLWNDQGLQMCFARSREYQLNDSAQ